MDYSGLLGYSCVKFGVECILCMNVSGEVKGVCNWAAGGRIGFWGGEGSYQGVSLELRVVKM